ncbi:MAG TPA: YncE family protein [Longimicrobium sp.]|jgi:DNA-binding beta-propeller fold protein YncE|nr:YncE family protein [Longimicrobium sp.]
MIRRPARHAAIALLLGLAVPAAAQTRAPAQEGPYRVLHRTVTGGDGGWDYLTVDGRGRRAFLSRGTHVMVVDLRGDSVAGDIPATPGVHGIALAPELGKGFTSNGRDSSVTVFDLRTLATTGSVRGTGRNPDAILYDPATRRVFTFNGGSSSATAIDAARGTIAGTVALAGKPEAAVLDGAGHVWVNIEDKSEIQEFDARTLRSLGHWALEGCEEPSGLAIDRAHGRLFSVCSNGKMAVTNMALHRVVATLPIGEGADGAAFDPSAGMAFSSNGDGTMTVVHQDAPDRYRVVQTLPTQRGARTIALDPATHRVYTVTAELGTAPAATAENPRPRRPVVPGTFVLLTIGRP